jgi:hypothetical protein
MKRSQINDAIEQAIRFCRDQQFHLPPWAHWQHEEWEGVGSEAAEIARCGLGWDVTDFGSGDFQRVGLTAFTIRNGGPTADAGPTAKTYCEKLLISNENQETPTHFHWSKMEDIINRGGGVLTLQLWNGDPTTEVLDRSSPVSVSVDGIVRVVEAGGFVRLAPGESITLPPFLYHRFYGEPGRGRVLGGEVSRVNDDENDNRFNPPLPRFSPVDEDEPPKYRLCNEYPEGLTA